MLLKNGNGNNTRIPSIEIPVMINNWTPEMSFIIKEYMAFENTDKTTDSIMVFHNVLRDSSIVFFTPF